MNLDGKLLHGGVKCSLVAGEIASDRVVEKKKLLLHHLHSVLVQKFQLDLNIRAELFKLCLLVVEAGQGLCLLQLVHLNQAFKKRDSFKE